jgi:hypothetical protein
MPTIATLRRRRFFAAVLIPDVIFEEDLLTYLSSLAFPVYPSHVPQLGVVPSYSFFLIDEEPYYLLSGPSAGLTRLTYQFSCWSTDFLESLQMEKSLRSLLHGFRGTIGSTPVYSSRLQSRFTQYEPNVSATDQGTFQVAVEYLFMVRDFVIKF